MKLITLGILLLCSFIYVAPAPCCPQCPNSPCFNPEQAMFQKFPLTYRLKSNLCKLLCDPLKKVNECQTSTTSAPCSSTPIPVVYVPAQPNHCVSVPGSPCSCATN
ncbi:hypothetical protein GWI33_003442 [Rhynchophorus ferrugineus]|uniref:Uncharacterized protein n=1 Tax=Rhynchophorus ferrugineus TaxID=354439 RepID=A0A834MKV0_RHYFE|nr:hypothetical protein GWI33_003442 [Rhynchophorus ferrugineus]